MNAYQSHAAATAAYIQSTGAASPSFTWIGVGDFPIIPGSALRKEELDAGGFKPVADLRFEILLQPFIGQAVRSPEPINILTAEDLQKALQQNPITYLGAQYKVDSVEIRPGALQLAINANASGLPD